MIKFDLKSISCQYPDAPNLFSNYRRINRPTLASEFNRTWLISLIGIVMTITAAGILVWNEVWSISYISEFKTADVGNGYVNVRMC